ncbi:MAG TPA: family 1 glycosylhydrolase [Candidatus Saccharimonadales bacterium]
MDIKNLSSIKYFGASTSAHQVEGRNHNQWSVWELNHARELATTAEAKLAHWLPKWDEFKTQAQNPDNYVSGAAVDHFNRYEEDFDIAKQLNLNAFRFSIEWSRIEPKEGRWDDAAIEHYRQVLQSLHRRGLEPFVCLWHWTVPVWFEEAGGWTKKSNVDYFVRFCEKVAVELGEYFNYVIILNEPNTYMGLSYIEGQWPPNEQSLLKGLGVYRNLIKAHKRVYTSLKPIKKFFMSSSLNASHFYLGDATLRSRVSRWGMELMWNKWFLNRTEHQNDFIAIQFYQSDRIAKGRKDNPNRRQNDLGWNMEPARVQFVIEDMHKEYGKPILLAENGLADAADEQREWWIKETMSGMAKAVENSAEVIGYLHWSLLDNFEWAYGFWPRFGLVEVDRTDKKLPRTIRPSAKWWAGELKKIRQYDNDGE